MPFSLLLSFLFSLTLFLSRFFSFSPYMQLLRFSLSASSPLFLPFSLTLFFLFSSLFSEALIFNDILGCTKVPLMHGHYNMPLSLFLSRPLSTFLHPSLSFCPLYKGRVHACTPLAILPAAAFSIGQRSILPLPPILLFHPFSTHHRGELTSHRKSRAVSWKCDALYINL